VAYIVERNMKRNVLDFKAVDERICVLRIKTKFHNLSFINVHAPTEEKEAFYQKVEGVYDSCPSNDIKVVLGDMNDKVGKEGIYQGLIGRHSLHLNTNNNGQRLVNFAAAKTWWYPQPASHIKTFTNKPGDLQMENLITKLTIY
jgi:hypothetical protein